MSGGGEITTIIGVTHHDAGIRADATRYLKRKGYADLLPILGLADEPTRERLPCPSCGKPLPDPITSGGRKPCQRRNCEAGPKARGVKR